MEDKNLSEKIENGKSGFIEDNDFVFVGDLKESIKLLKKKCSTFQSAGAVVTMINEVFGEELTK